MKPLRSIIVRPLVTEKSTALAEERNIFVFEVARTANKIEIARAIRDLYNAEVVSVRTAVMRGKSRRFGRHYGTRPAWKKAFVRVADGSDLNIYDADGLEG